MKFKSLMPGILFLLLTLACKNNENPQNENINSDTDVEFSPTPNEISRKDTQDSIVGSSPSSEEQNRITKSEAVAAVSEGKYIKSDQREDDDCGCYCLEINFDLANELCLLEGAMYISTRMEQDGNKINVYFVEPSSRNSEGKDIPWQEFDTTTPIAVITAINNEEIELDWLGFAVNGDLAMDYALYGKKTLEGDYKKK